MTRRILIMQGFKAQPIHNDIFHWQVSLTGFGDSKLGQDLLQWSLHHTQISDQMKEIEQDIQLELKFPR